MRRSTAKKCASGSIGRKSAGHAYLAGLDAQKTSARGFDAAFPRGDAIVTPTVPVPAPPIGVEHVEVDGEQIGVRAALVG